MSYVERDDILTLIEGLTAEFCRKCVGATISLPLRA